MSDSRTKDLVSRQEAQTWVDAAVSQQQDQYRSLFAEFQRMKEERDKYRQALQDICSMGRSPIAEGVLGI